MKSWLRHRLRSQSWLAATGSGEGLKQQGLLNDDCREAKKVCRNGYESVVGYQEAVMSSWELGEIAKRQSAAKSKARESLLVSPSGNGDADKF